MVSGIYHIYNCENGKRYIGSSKNVSKRIKSHKRELAFSRHRNKHLQNAYNKYGKDNFNFELIENVGVDSLLDKEKSYLEAYLSANLWDFLYNIAKDVYANMRGFSFPEETLEEMSEMRQGDGCSNVNKVSREEYVEILGRFFVEDSLSQEELSEEYGISVSQVYRLVKGECWNNVNFVPIMGVHYDSCIKKASNNDVKLTVKEVVEIRGRYYLEDGLTQGELADVCEISRACVTQVVNGGNWRGVKFAPISGTHYNASSRKGRPVEIKGEKFNSIVEASKNIEGLNYKNIRYRVVSDSSKWSDFYYLDNREQQYNKSIDENKALERKRELLRTGNNGCNS